MELQSKPIPSRSVVKPAPQTLGIANKRDTAQYIADMALEMRNLAKACEMLTLQGLLEVAYYEAFTAATEIRVPDGEAEKIKELSRASVR